MRIGRRQNKDHVCRRLFQSLEQSIERARRQHMNFVNNIDFIIGLRRCILDLVSDVSDFFNAVIGSSIDFDHIVQTSGSNRLAGFAFVARVTVDLIRTVQSLCEQLGARSLAGSPWPRKQIRMRRLFRCQRIFQCFGNHVLTDKIFKGLRSPNTIQCLIAHRSASFLFIIKNLDPAKDRV